MAKKSKKGPTKQELRQFDEHITQSVRRVMGQLLKSQVLRKQFPELAEEADKILALKKRIKREKKLPKPKRTRKKK